MFYNYWNNYRSENKIFRRSFYKLRFTGYKNYRFFANMTNWAKLYPKNTFNPRVLLDYKSFF